MLAEIKPTKYSPVKRKLMQALFDYAWNHYVVQRHTRDRLDYVVDLRRLATDLSDAVAWADSREELLKSMRLVAEGAGLSVPSPHRPSRRKTRTPETPSWLRGTKMGELPGSDRCADEWFGRVYLPQGGQPPVTFEELEKLLDQGARPIVDSDWRFFREVTRDPEGDPDTLALVDNDGRRCDTLRRGVPTGARLAAYKALPRSWHAA